MEENKLNNDETILKVDSRFKGLVDKRNTLMLLGCYCNSPRNVNKEDFSTTQYDYSEKFHRDIWASIVNITKKYPTMDKITSIEIENELSSSEKSLEIWKLNSGAKYIERAIELTKDNVLNIGFYRDEVKKYSMLLNAKNELNMDIGFIYDETDEVKMQKFKSMTSREVLAHINNKFNNFKDKYKSNFGDNMSFHLGDNIDNTVKNCKNKDTSYGYPFQSKFMTTIFRGMKGSKFIIRSSKSGGGKSRSSMAEAGNMSCSALYDWEKKKWVSTGEVIPVLFISTELTEPEIETCVLAHISGIEEDRIVEWKDITPEEEKVINEAKEVIKQGEFYGEYMPDFTIDLIDEKIEYYYLNFKIGACFFDYINDSPQLYAYYKQKSGLTLQTHQILFMFSEALKRVCNKYNIYLGSSTQLSSNWKDEKDANAIKGSKAIIEKADGGIISLPVTSADLKKLDPIFRTGIYPEPTNAYYVYKNRGNKWNNVVVWTRLNMGNMREVDCFVTDNDYNLILNIEQYTPTNIFAEEIDIGNINYSPIDEGKDGAKDYIENYISTKVGE